MQEVRERDVLRIDGGEEDEGETGRFAVCCRSDVRLQVPQADIWGAEAR